MPKLSKRLCFLRDEPVSPIPTNTPPPPSPSSVQHILYCTHHSAVRNRKNGPRSLLFYGLRFRVSVIAGGTPQLTRLLGPGRFVKAGPTSTTCMSIRERRIQNAKENIWCDSAVHCTVPHCAVLRYPYLCDVPGFFLVGIRSIRHAELLLQYNV